MKAPLSDQLPPVQLYDWSNPHAPVVGPDGGLAGAVVFLRGVDPRRGRAWRLPAVTVECTNWRFDLRQGGETSRVGFVRAGDQVTLVSRQDVGHAVEARGSAFFTYTLPEPHRERSRKLATPGGVELASAAGFYWMRAYLFVDDHPYYVRTDAEGRFELPDVPEGEYELVAWHPHWGVASRERNQDSFRIVQVRFMEPLTCVRKVQVERGRALDVALELGE